MSYKWKLSGEVDSKIIDKFPEIHSVATQLLYNRGLTTQEQIDEFLQPDYSQDLHDPFLFSQMTKACERIYQAIKNKEKITVYGDYDADGVSSTVILKSTLERLGGTVETYLPHREKEGYGLNKAAIEEIAGNGTKLLITCDCGISNVEEVEFANSQNLEVIVTDHHQVPPNLPPAVAIVHPQLPDEPYPFKFLAGGGVAFKLVQGLLSYEKNHLSEKEAEVEEKWLLDLVAISTVADMMPLLGENRTLLKYGLTVLKKTKRLGLQKLIEVAKLDTKKLDAQSISYSLAPRINAAGRMDHANLAFYLMVEEDPERAQQLAKDLNQSNIDRQKLTEQIVSQAKVQYRESDSLLTFFDPSWAAGLTGLVAGRLVREYNRPCLVMTEIDGQVIGSGRSIEGFDITAALEKNKDLLERFGGHPQAAGFTVKKENFSTLLDNLKIRAKEILAQADFTPSLDIELAIDFREISWDLLDVLEKFQPFGQANPEPVFVSYGLKVTAARKVGLDQKHWKLELAKENKARGAIAFGLGKLDLAIGDKVDIAYNLSINQWNGNREIQLMIKDIHPVKSSEDSAGSDI